MDWLCKHSMTRPETLASFISVHYEAAKELNDETFYLNAPTVIRPSAALRRLFCVSTLAAVAFLAALTCPGPAAWAQTGRARNRSRGSAGISGAHHPNEQRRRAGSPPHRAAGPGSLDTAAKPVENFLLFGYELIRGTASDGKMSGDQSLSGADPAGLSRRNADRPFRQRPERPHHPRLLRSRLHAQGRDRADLSGADDLVARSICTCTGCTSARRATPTT